LQSSPRRRCGGNAFHDYWAVFACRAIHSSRSWKCICVSMVQSSLALCHFICFGIFESDPPLANDLAIDFRYSGEMLRTFSLLGGLAPLCVLAAIVVGYRVSSPPQHETTDLSPLISDMQRTFSQADVTGSIEPAGIADTAFSGHDLANKLAAVGEAKRRRKALREPNQITSYKPDITPPNFTNSAY